MSVRKEILILVGLLGVLTTKVGAQLPQARMDAIEPVAVKAGETGEVLIRGKDLDGPQRLLFSHPGITAAVISKEDPFLKRTVPVENRFTVTSAGNVPPGIYDVWAAGKFGVSNGLGFAVTDLPMAAEKGGEEIRRVELNQAVVGVMGQEKEEAFAVPLMPGQEVRVICYGRRLGSRLDGVLRVVAPDGKEVGASSRSGRTVDPEVAFKAEVAGDYLVTFFDYTYRGGSGYGYLLEVRAGAKPGNPVDANGAILEDAGRDGDAAFVQKVGFPARIAGRFIASNDRDVFEVELGGGRKVQMDVRSDRIGEMTDAVLVVERVEVDGEGKEVIKPVAEADDWSRPGGRKMRLSHRDPSLLFDAPAEPARYRVTVLNRFPVRGDGGRYELKIGEPKQEFELVATSDLEGLDGNKAEPVSPVVRAGGTAKIQVYAIREGGHKGAIDLKVEGLPSGVSADSVRIPEGAQGAVVMIRAPKGAAAWSGPIKLMGEADLTGARVKKEAKFRGGLWAVNDMNREEMAARNSSGIVMGVLAEEMPDVKLELKEGGPAFESCKGGRLAIPVKITVGADAKLKGNVAVTPVGFDGYVKVPNVGIAIDKKEGVLNLDFKDGGGNVFKPGEYAMVLRGEAQFDYEPGPEGKDAAEKEKGEIDAAVKAAEEELKKATAAKAEGAKKLDEAKKKLAAARDPGDARSKAEAEIKAAEAASAAAVQAETDLKKRVDDGKKALQAADQRVKKEVERMKKRQVKFATYSVPISVKLATSPIVVTAIPGTAAAGEKGEVVVKVERKYGFNANVQLALSAPGDTKGIKLNVPAANGAPGKDTPMAVTVAGDSAAGELELTLTAKGNFNGVNFQEQVPVKFAATPKKDAAAEKKP